MIVSSEEADRRWMMRAIQLSCHCPPATGAYSVGAIIVSSLGDVLATGFSRDADPFVHAEESALNRIPPGNPRLVGATLYSTLEPCSERRSRPLTCAQLIVEAGIRRVAIAWREPSLFVSNSVGVELLKEAGVQVVELSDLAETARAVNQHLMSEGCPIDPSGVPQLPRRTVTWATPGTATKYSNHDDRDCSGSAVSVARHAESTLPGQPAGS